jgi:hypothetical protein
VLPGSLRGVRCTRTCMCVCVSSRVSRGNLQSLPHRARKENAAIRRWSFADVKSPLSLSVSFVCVSVPSLISFTHAPLNWVYAPLHPEGEKTSATTATSMTTIKSVCVCVYIRVRVYIRVCVCEGERGMRISGKGGEAPLIPSFPPPLPLLPTSRHENVERKQKKGEKH